MLKILLDEEYGYKYYYVTAECSQEQLQTAWDAEKFKGCFYFDALGFFKKYKIPYTARPCTYGFHPLYGTGRFILKEGFENNDMVGGLEETPQCWESAKGVPFNCYIHLHDDDDSGISFAERVM